MLASADAIALSPDGRFGILGLSDGPIQVWDTTSGKVLDNKDEYLPHRSGHSVTAIAAYAASDAEPNHDLAPGVHRDVQKS